MRITNQMVSGNALRNMQKSMERVDDKTKQMTSGKKIQQASEDPVIAVRALKLRTTVNQLTQYKEKNIPDASSWYNITTTSLDNITSRLTQIYEYCVQGSTDSFNTDDRAAIIDTLKQFQDMLASEGNSTYAGRYIFSGYKTDRSLAYTETEDTDVYSYMIKQKIDPKELDTKNVVLHSLEYDKADDYINEAVAGDGHSSSYRKINTDMVYRLNVAYEGIDDEIDTNGDGTKDATGLFSIEARDKDGNLIDLSSYLPAKILDSKTPADLDQYYDVSDGKIQLIKETGEIIFDEDVYNILKTANSIEVTYAKNDFNAGDLRPEHYFDCTQYKTQTDGSRKIVDYTQPKDGQEIYYEVNFSQSIKVNTEGREIINSETENDINDLIYALQALQDSEKTQNKIKAMLSDDQYTDNENAVKMINEMLADIDVEVAVKKENMQKVFSANIANFQRYLDEVSAMQSDVGSRMTKLEMIETRVREQLASFKELKSQNEDVESDVAITNLNEANLAFNAALAATGSIIDKTLLDYI